MAVDRVGVRDAVDLEAVGREPFGFAQGKLAVPGGVEGRRENARRSYRQVGYVRWRRKRLARLIDRETQATHALRGE